MKIIIPAETPTVTDNLLLTTPKVWGSQAPDIKTNNVVDLSAALGSTAAIVSNSAFGFPRSIVLSLTLTNTISNPATQYPFVMFSTDSLSTLTGSVSGILFKDSKIIYRDLGVDRYSVPYSLSTNTKVEVTLTLSASGSFDIYVNNYKAMTLTNLLFPSTSYVSVGAVGCTIRVDDFRIESNGASTILETFEGITEGTKSLNTVLNTFKVAATGGTGGSVSISKVAATDGSTTTPQLGVVAPADGSTLKGVVTLTVTSNVVFANAELLPETGYTPIYGRFTMSSDGKSASLQWDTNNLSDRTAKFRISTYNLPPNMAGATETVVMPSRTWTIANSTTTVTTLPAHVVDFYGMSFTRGWDGNQYVATPPTDYLKLAYPQLTVNNLGINSSDLVDLMQGDNEYYYYPFYVTVQVTTADVIILHSGFNESVDLTVAQYKSYLTQFYDLCTAQGKKVIFMSIHRNLVYDQSTMAAAMQETATALGAGYIDLYTWSLSALTGNLTFWEPDNYHLTQTGYTLMGQYIASVYKSIYYKLFGLSAGGTPGSGVYPAIAGPLASSFNATPTFYDDFDGSFISNKWNQRVWYQSQGHPGTKRLSGGCLEMTLQPESMFTGSNDTTYSVITTDPSVGDAIGFTQKYGVWQIEAKLPAGKGCWPAFWLFNQFSNGDRPEIDIFEAYVGGAFDWTIGSNPPRPSRADIAVHKLNELSGYHVSDSHNMTNSGLDLSAAFHKYTLEWDYNYMKFYFDGTLVWTLTNSEILQFINQYPLYTIIGLGVDYDQTGGPSADPNVTPTGFGNDPNDVPNNVFRVKYCAVWQWAKYL